MIAAPPLEEGAEKLTVIDPVEVEVEVMVGASGNVAGVFVVD